MATLNNKTLVCYDFETGGLSYDWHEAIQVAGKAYDPKTLEPIPIEDGGEFVSMMKPLHFDRLEAKALEVNKKTIQELEKAPDQKVVWNQFVNWVGRYNAKKSDWGAPIAMGKNIRLFDNKFAEVLNVLHCPKKDKTVLFDKRKMYDLDDMLFEWFGHTNDLENFKMDTVRDYMGMSKEGSHDALVDVRQTGDVIIGILKVIRKIYPKIQFKDCFKK